MPYRVLRKIAIISALVFAFVAVAAGTQNRALVPILNFLLLSDAKESGTFALLNANIYTVNPDQPQANALFVKKGIISRVGSNADITAAIAGMDKVMTIDLSGRFVMPGFQDAHLHVAEAGFNELLCVFSETKNSIADYEQEFTDCADDPANKDSPWILGSGISVAEMIGDTTQSPRTFLDTLFPDLPVLVLDNLGHGAWANSRAMQLAEMNPDAPVQPQGGVILTDSTGKATGEIFENAQQKLRDAAFTAIDPDQSLSYAGLLKSLQVLAKNGITTVSDAGGYWTRGDHLLWLRAEQENKMTVRASNALYVFPDRNIDQQLVDIKALYSDNANTLVNFSLVKIYVDGILSLGTSALKAPYSNTVVPALNFPNGFEYFLVAQLNRYVAEFEAKGFQVHFHVTGDRGAKLALDAIELAKTENNSSDIRHHLTHLYLVDPDDYARFNSLGVVASFQLSPDALDTTQYIPFLQQILGNSRVSTLLSVKSMLDSGANVLLSSDYDAGPLSPLGTIARALNRPDNASQNVPDIETAIKMVTINVANYLHQEARTGSIEVGKFADFVVLDQDITTLATDKIDTVKVLSTLLNGQPVYDPGQLFETQ